MGRRDRRGELVQVLEELRAKQLVITPLIDEGLSGERSLSQSFLVRGDEETCRRAIKAMQAYQGRNGGDFTWEHQYKASTTKRPKGKKASKSIVGVRMRLLS